MELRSRKSLHSKTAATPAPTPAPPPTPVATSPAPEVASLGRSATEPLLQYMREDQNDISAKSKNETPAPRASALEALRTSFPLVPAPRAHSTPATLQPQDQAFDILQKKIGKRLSIQDFTTYRALISDRVILVVDDAARRVRNTWKLKDFLKIHPGVLFIHNQFARSYNKLNNKIFHLPLFKPQAVQWHETSATTPTPPPNKRIKTNKASQPLFIEPVVAKMTETSKVDDNPSVTHANPCDSGGNDGDDPVPQILQLVPNAKSPGKVSMQPLSQEQAIFEIDHSGQAAIASSTGVDKSSPRDEAAEQGEQGLRLTSPVSPVVLEMSEEAQAQAARNVVEERAARPERAQAYLAWLHHRQARYPTVKPNYSECVLVAKKLGRPTPSVHDNVLHYWSLETDSRRGEWYRQNRVHTLGEDPRFDSENLSAWVAWLKQGRNEMERKAAAMEVNRGRGE